DGPAEPEALLPQAPRKLVPVAKRPTREARPGDLICGECGQPNTPTRKFCNRCGTSLADAEVVRAKWWRRLWNFLFRRRTRKAGARPGKKGERRQGRFRETVLPKLRMASGVVLLLMTLTYAFYPPASQWVNGQVEAAKRRVLAWISPEFAPIRPTSATATAQLPGHEAVAAVDAYTNTYWAASERAVSPALVLTFKDPANLDRILVTSGAKGDFLGNHRPKRLHLVYSTDKAEDVDLKDTPEPQQSPLKLGKDATSVQVHVTEVFRSISGHDVALTELELFTQKK
ncbi:hypothetical protein, partial [Allokutzneria sp. NRRL B-24872]|uniref:NADase-type glycan-binding domain-containing protein n=1 Tax=Allokutzneria sp. NRRL B-24872 TaxID=1137961 RepID=UPI000A380F9D